MIDTPTMITDVWVQFYFACIIVCLWLMCACYRPCCLIRHRLCSSNVARDIPINPKANFSRRRHRRTEAELLHD